jgi:Tol biopolymer transport system component
MKTISSLLSAVLVFNLLAFPAAAQPAPAADLQVSQSPLTVLEGGRGAIYGDYLKLDNPEIPPDQVRYAITSLPAHGALDLRGTALSIGDSFSQSEVDAGGLAYRHDGSETLADSFGYVAGTGWGEIRKLGLSSDTYTYPSPDVYPALSADGLWAAFPSSSTTLVPGKTTDVYDMFLVDVQAGQVTRVSQGINGQEANGDSFLPFLSSDGRFLLYTSYASNLVAEDTTNRIDAFLYDHQTGQTRLVSCGPDGNSIGGKGFGISDDGRLAVYDAMNAPQTSGLYVKDLRNGDLLPVSPDAQGNAVWGVDWASLSANGKFVAFDSYKSNLVPGDTDGSSDIFVYELETGITEMINVKQDGSHMTNGNGSDPSISEDGRYVTFWESMDGLVSGDENDHSDVYVRDRLMGQTELVDVNDQGAVADRGAQSARISPNGRFVTFISNARNLDCAATGGPDWWAFTRDRQTGRTWLASRPNTTLAIDGFITAVFGGYGVVDNFGHTLFYSLTKNIENNDYPPGQNGFYLNTAEDPLRQCGAYDLRIAPEDDPPVPGTPAPLQAGRGGMAPLTSAQLNASDPDSPPEQIFYTLTGVPAHGALYKDDSPLALGGYFTQADVDAGRVSYLNDRSQNAADELDLALSNLGPVLEYIPKASDGTPANYKSDDDLSVSGDGRYVTFSSYAWNLVPGDANQRHDIFLRDLLTQTTERVSLGYGGAEANGDSSFPSISWDGRWVGFNSLATNLVEGDIRNNSDTFTYDRLDGQTRRVSVSSTGEPSDGYSSEQLSLSANGRFVAFTSDAKNLVPGIINWADHVYVYDQLTGELEIISADAQGNPGNDRSGSPALSADGRYVAFQSDASNLVPGDDSSSPDIYIYDRAMHSMELASVDSQGQKIGPVPRWVSPWLSSDGRFVAFIAWNSGANHLYIRDRRNGQTELVPADNPGYHNSGVAFSFSDDARFATYSTYDGIYYQVWGMDRLLNKTWLASAGAAGQPGNNDSFHPTLTPNGALAVFASWADNLLPEAKLPGVYAWRGMGPTVHLDVQVDLDWTDTFLPVIQR